MTAQPIARRGDTRSRLLSWGLLVGAILSFVAVEVLRLRRDGWSALGTEFFIAGILNVLFFIGLGTLLSLRQPTNPIGWLLTAGGMTTLLTEVAGDYAARAIADGQGTVAARLAAALDANLFPLALGCSVALPLLLFPSGRLRSPWSKRLFITMLADIPLLLATFALTPGPLIDPTNSSALPVNPTGVERLASVTSIVTNVGLPIFMLSLAASVIGVSVRVRSAAGIERQQLRWVRAGAALAIGGVLTVYVGGYLLGLPAGIANIAFTIGLGCLPVSFTVAILRYRLYELDRIVSRTVTYGAVTGLLVAIYVGLVTAVSRLTPSGSSLAVASSTLAVAALFQPVRRRVQRAIDRRFNRARYDAARTVEEFSLRLRDEVDLEAIRADLVSVVRQTMQPDTASLWLRAGASKASS